MKYLGWTWCCPTLLIWALGRRKQVGLCELEDDLIYIVNSRPAEPWLHCGAVSFKRRGEGGEDQDEKEKEEEGRRRRKE